MNAVEIFFSPTGGTEKVANIISACWSERITKIDLSEAKTDFSNCTIKKDDQVLVAMPSFGGRAPLVAIDRLKQISGNGAKCTLVCIYGIRAYEDTLVKMEDAAKGCERCGVCVKNCPVQAIDPASFKADSKKCIACMRCVKECSENARKTNGAMVAVASFALKKVCAVAKENELFL